MYLSTHFMMEIQLNVKSIIGFYIQCLMEKLVMTWTLEGQLEEIALRIQAHSRD